MGDRHGLRVRPRTDPCGAITSVSRMALRVIEGRLYDTASNRCSDSIRRDDSSGMNAA